MRKKSFTLAFIVVVLGMMGIIFPGSAIPPEEELLPLFDDISDSLVGNIVIDPAHAHYAILANVGKQNGTLYYEVMAYNPSGNPMTITWGMAKANVNGHLRFNDKFDTFTLAWIKNYGRSGATYSIRLL